MGNHLVCPYLKVSNIIEPISGTILVPVAKMIPIIFFATDTLSDQSASLSVLTNFSTFNIGLTKPFTQKFMVLIFYDS